MHLNLLNSNATVHLRLYFEMQPKAFETKSLLLYEAQVIKSSTRAFSNN